MNCSGKKRVAGIGCAAALWVVFQAAGLFGDGPAPTVSARPDPAKKNLVMKTYTYKTVGELKIQADGRAARRSSSSGHVGAGSGAARRCRWRAAWRNSTSSS